MVLQRRTRTKLFRQRPGDTACTAHSHLAYPGRCGAGQSGLNNAAQDCDDCIGRTGKIARRTTNARMAAAFVAGNVAYAIQPVLGRAMSVETGAAFPLRAASRHRENVLRPWRCPADRSVGRCRCPRFRSDLEWATVHSPQSTCRNRRHSGKTWNFTARRTTTFRKSDQNLRAQAAPRSRPLLQQTHDMTQIVNVRKARDHLDQTGAACLQDNPACLPWFWVPVNERAPKRTVIRARREIRGWGISSIGSRRMREKTGQPTYVIHGWKGCTTVI